MMEDRPKKPTSVDVLSQAPRRDNYGPEHGSGSPNLDAGELQKSKAWKEHKPAKIACKERVKAGS
jgi:hypothetical protein